MKSNITTEVLTITPDMASQFLKHNEKNRKLSKSQLRRLSDAMKNGEFEFNGDPIRFDGKGRLLDGQHRLAACVKTGTSFKAVVIYNLPTDSFKTINQGAKQRSFADILSIEGEKNVSLLAGAVRFQKSFDEGLINGWDNGYKSPKSFERTLHKNPGLRDSISFCLRLQYKKGIMPISMLAFFHYNTSKFDKEMADNFVNRIIDGDGLKSNSPIYCLRERLLQNNSSTMKFSSTQILMLVAKAWNLEAKGAKIDKLFLPKPTEEFTIYGVTND